MDRKSSKLLIDEAPLLVMPSLAANPRIGLNGAIILQQLHFWLQRCPVDAQGWRWYAISYPEWQRYLRWWSEPTIRRELSALEGAGVIVARLAGGTDRTKHYSIDYAQVDLLFSTDASDQFDHPPSDQSDQMQPLNLITSQSLNKDLEFKREKKEVTNVTSRPAAADLPDSADGALFGGPPAPRKRAAVRGGTVSYSPAQLEIARALTGHCDALLKAGRKCRNPRTAETIAAGLAKAELGDRERRLTAALSWAVVRGYWQKRILNLAQWTKPEVWIDLLNEYLAALEAPGPRGPAPQRDYRPAEDALEQRGGRSLPPGVEAD